MLSSVYNQIIKNIRDSNKDGFVSKYLEETNLSTTTYELINNIDQTVSDVFFAKNFIETSLKSNTSSFTTILNDSIVCNVYFSIMINNSMNMLIGKIHDIDFIIAQHVTSCDFIYFPQYNYIKIIAHSSLEKSSNELLLLTRFLKVHPSLLDINDNSQSALKGFILSHGRPYHFFYDCAAMAHKLYKDKLLCKLDHFQTLNGNFIDFTKIYELDVINQVVKFDDLNHKSEVDGSIFFKVGLRFNKENTQIVNLIRDFDRRLNMAVNKLPDISTVYNEVLKLKKEGCFVLWFGVSTDKRSLENQIELLNSLVVELKKYHNICVVIDGWTVADSRRPLNPKLIESDINVLKEIQSIVLDTEFISLIGVESAQKIAIAKLIDFHISSAGTGSLWPSRIAQKVGLMHISHAFRDVSMKGHLHSINSTYMPSTLIEDINNTDVRIDFVSYKININKKIDFFKARYPILFTSHFDYRPLNLRKMVNIKRIDVAENLYRCVSSKPKIWLDTKPVSEIKGPYTLKIIGFVKFYSESTKNNFSKFYMDFGEGLSEKDKIIIDISKNTGKFEVSIDGRRPLKNLRFDVINAELDFTFQGLFYKLETIDNRKE